MKERLDVILVKTGYAPSREKAKILVREGKVRVDGKIQEKAGIFLEWGEIRLEVQEYTEKYVGRGGLKLEKALETWRISLENKVCMDIGASTGGFTDCMLQKGAGKVYAVDVGRDQLAEKLRQDKRVVCMEQTNFRYMVREDIQEELDFASADVSFISLTKILLPAGRLLGDGGQMVCLVNPQFEAGKGNVGKKGVVRDLQVHREVIGKIIDFADLAGFAALHLDYSPVRGPEGNIEYLLHLEKMAPAPEGTEEDILKKMQERGAGPSGNPCWKDLTGKVTREAAVSAR